MRWGQRTLHHLEQVSEFAQFTRVQVRNRPMNQLRREVSADYFVNDRIGSRCPRRLEKSR